MTDPLLNPLAPVRSHPLVSSALASGENRNIFEQLISSFVGDLQPEGALETTLAIRAATLAWRLNRAQRLETQVLNRRSAAGANLLESSMADRYARDAVEMVSRWEQSIERSLMKALAKLEEVQHRRKTSKTTAKIDKSTLTEIVLTETAAKKERAYVRIDP